MSKYKYQDSKLLAPVVYFVEPVKTSLWTVRAEHMHSTLDFCPKPTRKKTNIPLLKSSKELNVLINKLCPKLAASIRAQPHLEEEKKLSPQVICSFPFPSLEIINAN